METKGRKGTKGGDDDTKVIRRSESGFRPATQQRATVVSRSAPSSSYGGQRFENTGRQSFYGGTPMVSGGYAENASAGVTTFKEERTQEKADMQDLNNRLANYMEKMRYLEAMNKALEKEIEKLKKGKDVDYDKIKNMYEDELKQARKVIDDLSKEKAEADVKVLSLEDEIAFVKRERDNEEKDKEDYKNKADKLADQIGDYEGEIANLRFRVSALEDDIGKLQDTIKRYQSENARLRRDLDTETIAHINEANRAQGLEEELAFITQVYEQEIKELQDLARRDTTIEMRDFWKGEMGSALKEIQAEYDQRLDQISATLESKYNAQLSQISAGVNRDSMELNFVKDENKKLHNKYTDIQGKISELLAQNAALEERNKQLGQALREKDEEMDDARKKSDAEIYKLRTELDNVLTEMQTLMDAKLSLELEIAAYRKLLESEEGRFNMRSRLEDLGGFTSANADDMEKMVQKASKDNLIGSKSETTGRLTINRTSRGGVTFSDITPDGKCITIANNSSGYRKKNFKLKDWTIERKFYDGTPSVTYTFPEDADLPTEGNIHVFSEWSKHSCKGADEVMAHGVQSWGMGQADTVLRDENGAEKATHKQTFTA